MSDQSPFTTRVREGAWPLSTTLIAVAVILALGGVVAGALVGRGLVNARNGDRGVTVHGLAEREVKADLAILPLRFVDTGDQLSDVQGRIDADAGRIRDFLTGQGYRPEEIDLGRLQVTDRHANEYRSDKEPVSPRYILSQTLVVRTHDVDRVSATARRLGDLVREGVVLQQFQGPSYSFNKLNDVRPSMIAEATASARAGAQQFARDSRSHLGGIKSAGQGSFEVLARDATPGEGGEEQSLWKRLRVVTTVRYALH